MDLDLGIGSCRDKDLDLILDSDLDRESDSNRGSDSDKDLHSENGLKFFVEGARHRVSPYRKRTHKSYLPYNYFVV